MLAYKLALNRGIILAFIIKKKKIISHFVMRLNQGLVLACFCFLTYNYMVIY